MIKKLFLISALSFSATQFFSQAIELRDVHGGSSLVNGTTITVNGGAHLFDLVADIEATSKLSGRVIRVTKKEIFTGVSGTNNAICWVQCSAPIAYGSMPLQNTDTLTVKQDSTHIFNGHYYPQGLTGQTKMRYVFYDVNSPNDTAYVDVIFNAYDATSINETENKVSLKTYPNPVRNGELTVSVNEGSINNTSIVVTDILGKVVYDRNVSSTKTKINTSTFKSGVYFVSIRNDEKVLKTEKIIISNQ